MRGEVHLKQEESFDTRRDVSWVESWMNRKVLKYPRYAFWIGWWKYFMQITICSLLFCFYSNPTRVFMCTVYCLLNFTSARMLFKLFFYYFQIFFFHSAFFWAENSENYLSIFISQSAGSRLLCCWDCMCLLLDLSFFHQKKNTRRSDDCWMKKGMWKFSSAYGELFFYSHEEHYHHKSQFSEELFLHFSTHDIGKVFSFCFYNITQIHRIYNI